MPRASRWGIIGGLLGGIAGPLGLAAGAALGAGMGTRRTADVRQREAFTQARIEQETASKKATQMAAAQQRERDSALKKMKAGRMRAARRRIRGGLFGDVQADQQFTPAARLGG
jgi:hypothetical protein